MTELKVKATKKHPAMMVLVDDDIAEMISAGAWQSWNVTVTWQPGRHRQPGHYAAALGGKSLARMIMGNPPGMDVDHKNGDQLDDQRSNLRVCTRQQNLRNRRGWSSTGYKGARHRPAKPGKGPECYEAWISIGGRHKYLGRSQTAEGAARLYDRAAREHHGEYARLNFPDDDPGHEAEPVTKPAAKPRRGGPEARAAWLRANCPEAIEEAVPARARRRTTAATR